MKIKVIDGSGDFHSLYVQLFRTYPRFHLRREGKYFKYFVLVGDGHTVRIYPRDRGLEIVSDSIPVDKVIVDFRADIFNVRVVLDNKELTGDNVVFDIPGLPPVTATEFVKYLLCAVGYYLLAFHDRFYNLQC